MKYRPTWRTARKLSQFLFLVLFLVLFRKTDYAGSDTLPYAVNIFFRWDPLVAATVMLSARKFILLLFPSLFIILLTIVFGRVFCGWICPVGTLLDWLDKGIRPKPRPSIRFRKIKYLLLVLLLVSSLFGLQLIGFLDPFSLLVRGGTFAVDPIFNLIASGFFNTVYTHAPALAEHVTEPVYTVLKNGILPFRQSFYFLSGLSLLILAAIGAMEKLGKRFWCRNLCPLGAMLALFSRWSFFRRIPSSSCKNCPQCAPNCRMNAFDPDSGKLHHEECNMCMDCVDDCLNQSPRFTFTRQRGGPETDLSRRAFVASALAGIALPLAVKVNAASRVPRPLLLRPPGVKNETDFLSRCVRCGECMKVCIENALQPCFFESGYEGMFSPRLVPRLGYCEFNCTLCGQVCPTGAIPNLSLPEKQKAVIGIAVFDINRCLPYANGVPCMVCEEHCPTSPKAIRFRNKTVMNREGNQVPVKQPYIKEGLCIGCGICENKCPLPGASAVRVITASGGGDTESGYGGE
ncbi:MAG: 4Fe-4S binding protein [Acidobacteria bacterium]|nr:4Fe-4S binding protein [Acidobacteriota bacterium]